MSLAYPGSSNFWVFIAMDCPCKNVPFPKNGNLSSLSMCHVFRVSVFEVASDFWSDVARDIELHINVKDQCCDKFSHGKRELVHGEDVHPLRHFTSLPYGTTISSFEQRHLKTTVA